MDGKIAWLLWPRHELSPVSACFLLAAFHNSFILWWRHGRTPVRVCTCIRVLHAMHHFSPPRSARAAFFRLYLSSSRMMNNNRGTVARIYVGSVVPLIYEREPSPRPPWSVTIVRARAQVGKTGRGRVRFAFTETWLITARNSFSFR